MTNNPLARSSAKSYTMFYLVGGGVGLVLGVLSAYLYVRAADEHGHDVEPKKVKTMDAIKVVVAVTSLVRQITDLGAHKD